MKILSKADFVKLPAGTIFWSSDSFDGDGEYGYTWKGPMIKGEWVSDDGKDFAELALGWIENEDDLPVMLETGLSSHMCWGFSREGTFGNTAYKVMEPAEVASLIELIKVAV